MLNAAIDRGPGRSLAPAAHSAIGKGVTNSAEPSRLRVLIIDDDPSDISLMDRALRRMVRYEVQVLSATSLATARWVLAAEPQDLILIDYSLQAECGTELVRELSEQGSSIPVILLTSLWTAEIEAEVLEAGGVACLAKDDLTPRIMETTVRQALRGQALETTLHHVMAENHITAAPLPAACEGVARPARKAEPDRRYDIQALAVDAAANWHRQLNAGNAAPIAMRLHLADHPVYVHASAAVFQSAYAWVSAALPLSASIGTVLDLSVFERDGRGEVVVECSSPGAHQIGNGRGGRKRQVPQPALPVSRSEVSFGASGGHVVELVSPSSGKRTSVALPLAGSARWRA